jgi:hypothetical protein
MRVLSFETKRRGKALHWVSPHAGQVFCALGILAPHSLQYFIALSFDMPTAFSIDTVW